MNDYTISNAHKSCSVDLEVQCGLILCERAYGLHGDRDRRFCVKMYYFSGSAIISVKEFKPELCRCGVYWNKLTS